MGESGYTLGFRRKIAHKRLHAETGAFPSAGTAWLCAANRIALNAAFATPDSTVLLYIYISRFSVNPHYQQTRKIRQSCRHKFYPQLFLVAFSTSPTNGPRSLSQAKEGIQLGFAQRIAYKGLHGETRAFRTGGGITTLDTYCTFTNIPGPGVRTAYFAALGSWPGGALEERRKPSGQRCAYARRCPEASRPRWAA